MEASVKGWRQVKICPLAEGHKKQLGVLAFLKMVLRRRRWENHCRPCVTIEAMDTERTGVWVQWHGQLEANLWLTHTSAPLSKIKTRGVSLKNGRDLWGESIWNQIHCQWIHTCYGFRPYKLSRGKQTSKTDGCWIEQIKSPNMLFPINTYRMVYFTICE